MLKRIFIQNYALIDKLDIELNKGLQVITGETGAGKSIILGALRLILGERADLKSIKNTDSKSIIEVEFEVPEHLREIFDTHDLDFEPQGIIRREILPSGKSRAFINDAPTTLDVLKEISSNLVDIHSQFETSNLFNEAYQFKIIDGLSDNKKILPEYQTEYKEYKELHKKLTELENALKEGNKEADYKKFILSELEEIPLDEINLEQLQEDLSIQENAEYISENLSHLFQKVDQEDIGLLDVFSEIKHRLSKVAEMSHQFTELEERLDSVFIDLKDILFELQDKFEKIDIDQESLDNTKLKVDKINSLLLKHSVRSVEELIEIRDEIAQNQEQFDNLEENIAQTEKQIAEKKEKVGNLAKKLSKNRKKIAPEFSKKIETLLKRLGLEKAKIEVELSPNQDFSSFGSENIQILFQANTGFDLKPIQGAISGGERSRVMLAIKKIMAENAELPTLILDEIDTGVSGKVAGEIGLLMKEMSSDLQLIVITHLAQVASKGDNNYKVMKKDIEGKTQSNIVPLNSEEKLQEIAQLLSGSEVTKAAIEQAKELINS